MNIEAQVKIHILIYILEYVQLHIIKNNSSYLWRFCILFAKHCVLPFISFNPDKNMKKLIFRLSCKNDVSKSYSQNLNLARLLLKFMLLTPLHNIKRLPNKPKSVAIQCERKIKQIQKYIALLQSLWSCFQCFRWLYL